MRLLTTFTDPKLGQRFSGLLTSNNIDNQVEIHSNKDWGSDDYGTIVFYLWVIEEDQFHIAQEWLERFMEDPHSEEFKDIPDEVAPVEPSPIPITSNTQEPLTHEEVMRPTRTEKMGSITTAILLICTILFLFSSMSEPRFKEIPRNLPVPAVLSSPIQKAFLIDWPKAFTLFDEFIEQYGMESFQDLQALPPKGRLLLEQSLSTPYWKGVYSKVVYAIRNPGASWDFDAPLFEKEREGEVWRLFTPALLHANIFHILFNMLWLLVLGRQMEARLGGWRYLLFIIIAAIISNIAQYLMSGSNFIGFSGVVCAMIVFIWKRQKIAPWEGYLLHPSTVTFVSIFVFGILGIQVLSFVFELMGSTPFAAGIANTAHISGGFVGYGLACTKLFGWRK